MRAAYPIMLDVHDRLAVIVGGGAVAARKARGLTDAGAQHIRVVARDFRETFPAAVQQIREPYRSEHLHEAELVFAATDSSDVNTQVVHDARSRGVWVCRADTTDPHGDFATPAVYRQGGATLAVSVGSAALSAMIRDEIAQSWRPGWTLIAHEMESLRPQIATSNDPSLRREVFRSLATREAINVLESGGSEALRRWLIARYPQLGQIVYAADR